MRKILISAAVAAAALGAVPAAAQYGYGNQGYGNQGYGYQGQHHRGPNRHAVYQLERELQQIERRIRRQSDRGRISRREAMGLYRQIGRIRTRLDRAEHYGLSGREYANIRYRIQELRQRFREERHDYDNRRDRW